MMERTALLPLLFLAACVAEEPVHHVNDVGSFCLLVPQDFEEFRIILDDMPPPAGTDAYSLIGTEQGLPVTLNVGVNTHLAPPSDKIFIEYTWRILDDGTVTQTGRNVSFPDGASVFPPVAMSLFSDPDTGTQYFFRMKLEEDGFEDLFVGIVGSFRSLP